jgi:hypothetical protein
MTHRANEESAIKKNLYLYPKTALRFLWLSVTEIQNLNLHDIDPSYTKSATF